MFFDRKISKSSENYYLESGLYTSIAGIAEAMNSLIQERHNRIENCITVKMSGRTLKVQIYLAEEKSGLSFFSTDLYYIFGTNCLQCIWRDVGRKRSLPTGICLRSCPHTLSHDIHGRNWVQCQWRHAGGPFAAFFSFHFKAQGWRHYNYWTVPQETWDNLASCNLDHCSKTLFIVFTLTWETRTLEEHPSYLLVSLVLSWCLEMPPEIHF